MAMIEKPPLEAVYFAHAGVKGMKWGRRKARQPGNVRKGIARTSAGQKAKIGLFAVGSTIAAGSVLPLAAPITIGIGAAVAVKLLAREGKRPVRRKK